MFGGLSREKVAGGASPAGLIFDEKALFGLLGGNSKFEKRKRKTMMSCIHEAFMDNLI